MYLEQCPTLNIKDYKDHKRIWETKPGITTASLYITTSTGFEGMMHFESMPCHYGGRRWFFKCPCCDTKRTILRGVGKQLMCNACTGLPNKTTQVSRRKRATIKRARLLKQLGAKGCDLIVFHDHLKPEGMDWDKYNRLRGEYHALLKYEVVWLNKAFAKAGQEPFYDDEDMAFL